MTFSGFMTIVNEHLGIDASRRGTENLRNRASRDAIVDLQRFIRAYRQGHQTTYVEQDMIEKTCAHLGSLPNQAKPKAFYIFQVAEGAIYSPVVTDVIESWADLAEMVTVGRAVPYTVLWVDSTTGLLKATQLRSGTDATNTLIGIQRPNDYNPAAPLVWDLVSS